MVELSEYGLKTKMKINEKEMDDILAMYEVTTCEGQETDTMINLVKRIKKEKEKWIKKR